MPDARARNETLQVGGSDRWTAGEIGQKKGEKEDIQAARRTLPGATKSSPTARHFSTHEKALGTGARRRDGTLDPGSTGKKRI